MTVDSSLLLLLNNNSALSSNRGVKMTSASCDDANPSWDALCISSDVVTSTLTYFLPSSDVTMRSHCCCCFSSSDCDKCGDDNAGVSAFAPPSPSEVSNFMGINLRCCWYTSLSSFISTPVSHASTK